MVSRIDRRQWLGMLAAGVVAPMGLGLSACGGGGDSTETSASGEGVAGDLIRPMEIDTESRALEPTRFLKVGTQRIAVYESTGTGPAVVLVHGNSSSSKVWQKTMNGPLGRKYRMVALDLPGHGASANAAESERASIYSIPGYAGIIRGVAVQMGVEKALFVGWSVGGHAVLEARVALTKATGFMIFGTPPLPYPPAADFGGAFLKVGLGFVKDWTPEQAQEYVSDFLVPGAVAPSFMLKDALRTDGHARSFLGASIGTIGYTDEVQIVRTIARPLAILHGAQEQLVNLAYLRALESSIPSLWGQQVRVVESAGHALQWEQSSQFDALLETFYS